MKIKSTFTIHCVECRHRIYLKIVEEEKDRDPEKTGKQVAVMKCPQCGGKTDMRNVHIQRVND